MRILDHLKRRHSWLEHEIASEQARRLPDEARIAQLKKLKLAVKDRMIALTRHAVPRARHSGGATAEA
jgi:hypothetical protein